MKRLWPDRRPIVGMVHLLPLPGSPGWGGSMDAVIDGACRDAEALVEGGVDGVLVENYGDVPFYPDTVPPATIAAVTRAVVEVTRSVSVPVGVNVLRNDVLGAIGIAATTGAGFVRVNVHTGSAYTDQGLIEGRAYESIRVRDALAPEVAVFADVFVKHATPPPGLTLENAAEDCWKRGTPDALILTGSATGHPLELDTVRALQSHLPGAPIWVGSGVRAETIQETLACADGVIVGSAFQAEGKAGGGVEADRVRRLVDARGDM